VAFGGDRLPWAIFRGDFYQFFLEKVWAILLLIACDKKLP